MNKLADQAFDNLMQSNNTYAKASREGFKLGSEYILSKLQKIYSESKSMLEMDTRIKELLKERKN